MTRALPWVLGAAVAVSVVHYFDNYTAYEAFPQLDGGPVISRGLVGAAWFAFTAFGLAGWLLYRRGRLREAAVALAVYSGSGLVGIGHYLAPGMTEAVWWRQAHVIADIVLGAAVLVLALALVPRRAGG